MPDQTTILYRAAAVRDAGNIDARSATGAESSTSLECAVAVRQGVIIAAGHESDVIDAAGGRTGIDQTIDLPDALILPGFVNAHVHLDLTSAGPRPYEGDFIDWVGWIIENAPPVGSDEIDTSHDAAVMIGCHQSAAAGVFMSGDISRNCLATEQWHHYEQAGVSFLETLGWGDEQATGDLIDKLKNTYEQLVETFQPGTIGIQPHAPYSTSRLIYEQVAQWPCRVSTHLAETLEEIEFTRSATGPFADLLKKIGKWNDDIKPTGLHPIDYLGETVLDRATSSNASDGGGWLLAHCNYVEDEHLAKLANWNASVAYCPVASDYFGHHQDAGECHRYREMIQAGVNVSIGTDSIICQPPDEPQPLGILPQIRHLYQRDKTDPGLLLKMATTNGAIALGYHHRLPTLQPGSTAPLVAVRYDPQSEVDPLVQVLSSDEGAYAV